MADQLALFVDSRSAGEKAEVMPPRSRRADPPSSDDADQEGRASGIRRAQADAALELVRRFPGRTSRELSRFSIDGLPAEAEARYHAIARRLPSLLKLGYVERRLGWIKGKSKGAKPRRISQWWPTEGL